MFFLLPIQVKVTGERGTAPMANLALIAANIVLYFLGWLFGWPLGVGRGSALITVVSYAFYHFNVFHLLINMWLLWIFGNPVNRRIGNGWYVFTYFATVILLGLAPWHWSTTILVGSSGAIYAVLMLFMLLLPTAKVRVGFLATLPLTIIIALFAKPRHWLNWIINWGSTMFLARMGLFIVPLMVLWDLLWSNWHWIYMAHLGGLLCGLVIVLILPERITMRRAIA